MPRRSCLDMYEQFRKEYELTHRHRRPATLGLRASTYALLRVLDELRREDGPSAAGA
jgi:hypothetical protein